MTVLNLQDAARWMGQGKPVSYNRETGQFVHGDWRDRVHRFFSGDYERRKVQKIVDVAREAIISDTAHSPEALSLWQACVKRYGNHKKVKKILLAAERELCAGSSALSFQLKENAAAFEKWQRYGHDPEIFRDHPEFSRFVIDSNLLSQMKVTRDTLQFRGDRPGLIVEGEWMDVDAVLAQFTFKFSKRYHEVFIVRKNDQEVFTYLDNGKGLQLHHPYLTKKLTPITTLNDDELDRLQAKAASFDRSGASPADRPFVLQIVSSYVKGPNTNFHERLIKRKHPYLRIVIGKDNEALGTKKGEVYEVGYGWKRKPLVPFMLSTGQFRSPDVWEYMPCEERVVTNIPVSQEEAHNVFEFTTRYHNESVNLGHEIGFHLGRQNCSVYVKEAAKRAGVEVPTEIKITDFLRKVCPDWIKAIGRAFAKAVGFVRKWTRKAINLLPDWINNPVSKGYTALKSGVVKILRIAVAFCFNPFRLLLGDGLGTPSRGFADEDRDVKPAMQKLRSFFSIPTINLPGELQEWQRQQPSTEIFKQPRQFAVVS